jgi:hypothetical protein
MTITEIQNELTGRHQSFCDFMNTLAEKEFTFSSNSKWSAGQQLDHICRATSLLPMGLSFPAFVRRLLFGKPNRTSNSYDELVKDYLSVLDTGGKASGIFIPKAISFSQREELVKKLQATISKINSSLSKYTEEELDNSLLPHPLLGKLTLREMMLFTIYHAEHHHKLAKKYIEDFKTTSVSF